MAEQPLNSDALGAGIRARRSVAVAPAAHKQGAIREHLGDVRTHAIIAQPRQASAEAFARYDPPQTAHERQIACMAAQPNLGGRAISWLGQRLTSPALVPLAQRNVAERSSGMLHDSARRES